MDGSNGVTSSQLKKIKSYIIKLIETFDISPRKSRVSIILYGDSSEESTIEAIKAADKYYISLEGAERAKTALVYLDTTGNKANIQSIADMLKPSIQSMPGYLSRGYSKSLAHLNNVEEFPFLVELKSSGRIISEHKGLNDICSYFK